MPYLQLREALPLGDGLTVVPADDLDAGDPHATEARSLLDKYARPSGLGRRTVGAFLCRNGRVGTVFSDEELKRAHRTVGFALLEANPKAVAGEYRSDGNSVWTTENALIRGHRLGGGTFAWVHLGFRRHNSMGPDSLTGVVSLPPGVMVPSMAAGPDAQLSKATWNSLKTGTQRSRRIGRGIDWLMSALQNAEIDQDTRLSDAYSGFDALLGDDATMAGGRELQEAICALLDPPGEPTSPRTLVTRRGTSTTADLTDRGWWFFNLTFLRNGIEHGYDVQPNEYLFGGQPQLNRAETELRCALLKMIADEVAVPTIGIADRFQRQMAYATSQALLALETDAQAGA
jgi:hypothetical protein